MCVGLILTCEPAGTDTDAGPADGGNAELMPWVTIEAGEQRRLSGDPDSAREHFERVARTWPEHAAKDAAILGLALLAYDAGNASGNSEATLGLVSDAVAPPTMNADRYRLLALAAAKRLGVDKHRERWRAEDRRRREAADERESEESGRKMSRT